MGAAVTILRLDYSADELRRMPDGRTAQRLLAIALVMEGVPRAAAAKQCGMDRQALRDWVHRYNEGGIEGLRNRESPDRPSRLNSDQTREFAGWVEEGPQLARDGSALALPRSGQTDPGGVRGELSRTDGRQAAGPNRHEPSGAASKPAAKRPGGRRDI